MAFSSLDAGSGVTRKLAVCRPPWDPYAPLDLATSIVCSQATWPKSFVGRGKAGTLRAFHSQEKCPRLLHAAFRCILLRNLVSLT